MQVALKFLEDTKELPGGTCELQKEHMKGLWNAGKGFSVFKSECLVICLFTL